MESGNTQLYLYRNTVDRLDIVATVFISIQCNNRLDIVATKSSSANNTTELRDN